MWKKRKSSHFSKIDNFKVDLSRHTKERSKNSLISFLRKSCKGRAIIDSSLKKFDSFYNGAIEFFKYFA